VRPRTEKENTKRVVCWGGDTTSKEGRGHRDRGSKEREMVEIIDDLPFVTTSGHVGLRGVETRFDSNAATAADERMSAKMEKKREELRVLKFSGPKTESYSIKKATDRQK